MEWFIIEALVALAVGIAIVWWTITPSKKLPRTDDATPDKAKPAGAVPGGDNPATRKAD
jgi:hypothetical protein